MRHSAQLTAVPRAVFWLMFGLLAACGSDTQNPNGSGVTSFGADYGWT